MGEWCKLLQRSFKHITIISGHIAEWYYTKLKQTGVRGSGQLTPLGTQTFLCPEICYRLRQWMRHVHHWAILFSDCSESSHQEARTGCCREKLVSPDLEHNDSFKVQTFLTVLSLSMWWPTLLQPTPLLAWLQSAFWRDIGCSAGVVTWKRIQGVDRRVASTFIGS